MRSFRAILSSSTIAELVRYGLVGVLNTLLTLSIIVSLIYWFDAAPLLANAIGYVIGFLFSFAINRLWTFRSRAPMGRAMGRYVVAALIAYVLNALVIHFGIAWAGFSEYWVQPMGAVVYTLSLYLLSRGWVFSNDKVSRTAP